jgi:kumamolisin
MSDSPEAGQPPAGYVQLKGSERTPRPSFHAVGPADPDEAVRVVIKVRPKAALPDPAELGAVRPSERPAPQTMEEHTETYGADQADVDAVTEFARQQGLRVEEADASTRLVVLSGTVSSVSAAFGTSLERFESPEHGMSYRGRVGHIHVPPHLEEVITVVTGLDNRPQAQPRQLATHPRGLHRYTPPQLAQIYSFPDEQDGTGQCIGLLEFGGGYNEADLDHYFKDMKVARPAVTAVSVDGTVNSPGGEADYEVVLDIEVAGAAAPGTSIAVYFAQFTAAGWVEAITKAIHDTANGPSVVSISWGYAEFEGFETFAWTAQVMDEVNTVLKEAANLGITVILAAGDDGSIDGITEDGKVHVDFPASSPYVLCCGGTTLYASKDKRTSEVVWSQGIRAEGPGHGSTGGGVSEYFPVPPWQTASPAKVPPSASTGFAGRGVPDVAAVADGRTGYAQYINGKMITDGGTSAAAPLWAALIARINQSLAAGGGGKRVGYWNPLLYASVGGTAAFHDITEGTNDALGNLDGAYTAGAGWDACTGWGTPNGTGLLNEL